MQKTHKDRKDQSDEQKLQTDEGTKLKTESDEGNLLSFVHMNVKSGSSHLRCKHAESSEITK